jgi:hypothetical protein
MVYPGAGVANSSGSAWNTSYAVGTGANNLPQLNGSGLLLPTILPLPGVSTLGAVFQQNCDTDSPHEFLVSINADGSSSCENPTQFNGVAVPASILMGTNPSSQPIAATAHLVSVPLACVAASASGSSYTCSTSPTFVPASGDTIWFKADVASTGAATLNVNSSSAISIKKQGGGTALVANDLLAHTITQLTYDGTNWQMQGQTGNASGATPNFYPGAYSGASATAGYGPVYAITTPPSTGWSWFNQNSATIDATGGYLYLDSATALSGSNLVGRVMTAPSTPYSVVALLMPDVFINTSANGTYAGYGICFSDGTKFVTFRANNEEFTGGVINGDTTDFDKWTNATTFSADYTLQTYLPSSWTARGLAIWMKLTDDGTNLSAYRSIDGQHWIQYGSNQSRTGFMTGGPTEIGFFVYSQSQRAAVSLLSWTY